ncbi:MAG: threonine/serine exporter family protein [Aliidongia sp.]
MTSIVEPTTPRPAQVMRAAAIETVARAAALLLDEGQTTERTVLATERLGRALGLSVRVLPRWDEIAIYVEGTPFAQGVPAAPLGVHMGRVLATMTVIDQVCSGVTPMEAVDQGLAAAERLPPASTPRFVLFAAIGAASLGVTFGTLDLASLTLIALSAAFGAVLRRWLAKWFANPFFQPLSAAIIAGVIGACAVRFNLSDTQSLIAICPCMVLVPGPHILNGAIDLARARVALGIARLGYAGLTVLMICAGLLLGLAAGGAPLPTAAPSVPVPFGADVIAAGCAVAAFGTFFSMPWHLLPVPIVVGMLVHAARWALISLAGAHVATGALLACFLAGIIVTPAANRLHLPFAALGFSAVVSMMPGLFLFRAASALVGTVSIGDSAPLSLLESIVTNGTTAFLIILAMTFGLILPRLLLDRLPSPVRPRRP